MNKKLYFIPLFLFVFCLNLKAQEFNTNESIKSQILNNKVPGAKYAPVAVGNTPTPTKGYEGSSLAKALREGTVEGLKFLFTPISTTTTGITNVSPKFGLASEMSASDAKAAREKEPPLIIVQPNIQNEGTKE